MGKNEIAGFDDFKFKVKFAFLGYWDMVQNNLRRFGRFEQKWINYSTHLGVHAQGEVPVCDVKINALCQRYTSPKVNRGIIEVA